ncbi:MAG TPA: hypothetical protein VFA04_28050 [Bryobacteraceae bacterium]|nr:hypothetical protein [Bryobacteraceae bacterium]
MAPRSIILAVCCLSPILAQNADWRFTHPDAKVFVGIKLRRLRESQVGIAVRDQMRAQLRDQGISLTPKFPGTELLDQISDVLISSPGRPDGAAENAQPPVLIRIAGEFDANKVESFFAQTGAKMQKYRHYRVFRQKGDGDMAASLIDPRTLLLGDATSLFAALERMEWTDAPKNPLLAQAMDMQAQYDLWALFTVTPSSLSSAQVPQLAALDALRGLDLGISVNDGLSLRLGLNTDSPEEAGKLAAQLKALLFVALKQHGAPADLAALANSIRFDVEQNSVRLQAKVGAAELKKALAEAQRRFNEQRAQVAAVHPRPAPEPQGPKVIRIEGLDDGPREIPYK